MVIIYNHRRHYQLYKYPCRAKISSKDRIEAIFIFTISNGTFLLHKHTRSTTKLYYTV